MEFTDPGTLTAALIGSPGHHGGRVPDGPNHHTGLLGVHGWRINGLAKRLGYHPNTVSNWRRGDSAAPWFALAGLARIAGYRLTIRLEPLGEQ